MGKPYELIFSEFIRLYLRDSELKQLLIAERKNLSEK